jgi:pyrimidine operon attenuation protein / uracil phosphoribosyltransferase
VPVRKTIPAAEIAAAIDRIAEAITGRHRHAQQLTLVGIANGGIPFARRLAEAVGQRLGREIACGTADITFYRDDIGRRPIPAEIVGTDFPGSADGATVILCDDVLFSGRTVRAAIDEIFALGRPSLVELAVLVDRGNRRLPIAADYVGFNEPAGPEERVRVQLDLADSSRDSISVEST